MGVQVEPQRDRGRGSWLHYGSKVQAQAVVSQSSYYSCNDPRLHFGLGVFTRG